MYFPRTELPETGNKYYNRPPAGENPCIAGNYPYNSGKDARTGFPGLDVLPNCTGFATGYFNELLGADACKYLGDYMAYYMITAAKKQGLEIGNTPKPGACMCWGGGSGHVAIVAQVISKTVVLTAESGWNTTKLMWNQIRQKGSGNWGENSHTFQGFIYLPGLEFEFCPYTEPTAPISKGTKGTAVKWMQWSLNWLGYGLAVDGSFGPASDKALRDFQSRFGLPVTGWLDDLTKAAIVAAYPWNEWYKRVAK